MKTVAIILAAGAGERFRAAVPKQYVSLNGKVVAAYSIETFRASGLIDYIVLVSHPHWVHVAQTLGVDKVIKGGASRNESTFRGLEACPPDTEYVLIHDAVRPFLDESIIRRCVEGLKHWAAVDTCIASADTIVQVDGDQIINVPPRDKLRRGQTPQAFRYNAIMDAYRNIAIRDATDDITLTLRHGLSCGVVEGSNWNIKITEPQDLFVAERMQQYRDADVREPNVRGKNILVLGASGGIGSQIVRELKQRGANVHDPTREQAELSKASLPQDLFGQEWDCIIHCAGVIETGMDMGVYDRTMNVNFRSAVLVADLAEKTMRPGSSLIYVGSSSAMKGRAKFPLYSASKAALNNFTEAMAERFVEVGIAVNCINPGQTLTPMLEDANLPSDSKRALSVEHVARVIIGYCDTTLTGQIVNIRKNVDGAI